MDGTFNSAPLLFQQSFLYAFLSDKTQSVHEELFQSIADKCQELGFQLDPATVTTDYELAVIKTMATNDEEPRMLFTNSPKTRGGKYRAFDLCSCTGMVTL